MEKHIKETKLYGWVRKQAECSFGVIRNYWPWWEFNVDTYLRFYPEIFFKIEIQVGPIGGHTVLRVGPRNWFLKKKEDTNKGCCGGGCESC